MSFSEFAYDMTPRRRSTSRISTAKLVAGTTPFTALPHPLLRATDWRSQATRVVRRDSLSFVGICRG